jgi:hypothetical protein
MPWYARQRSSSAGSQCAFHSAQCGMIATCSMLWTGRADAATPPGRQGTYVSRSRVSRWLIWTSLHWDLLN